MLQLIAKIFGSKSGRDIKRLMPLVDQAIKHWEELKLLSHDQLREESTKIQNRIREELSGIDDQLAALHQKIADQPDMDINEKELIFSDIDRIELDRTKELEKVLLKVLPRAFAIVRDTARRFKENTYLEVTAQDFDRQFAAMHENVKIVGDKAHWYNQWMAAGNLITWDMVHYDVQLIGGAVLHEGKVAEMATGAA